MKGASVLVYASSYVCANDVSISGHVNCDILKSSKSERRHKKCFDLTRDEAKNVESRLAYPHPQKLANQG